MPLQSVDKGEYRVHGNRPCLYRGFPVASEAMTSGVTYHVRMQAYFAIAEGLRHHEQLKSSGGFLSNELLGSIDPSMREAHLILKRRNANPW